MITLQKSLIFYLKEYANLDTIVTDVKAVFKSKGEPRTFVTLKTQNVWVLNWKLVFQVFHWIIKQKHSFKSDYYLYSNRIGFHVIKLHFSCLS